MINSFCKYITLIIFLFAYNYGKADQPNALQVLKKVEKKLVSSSMYAELNITIKRPRWTKNMTLNTWSKGSDYAAAYVSSPEKDKGTVYIKTTNNVYNYLPRIRKTVKLPATMLNQSWMGTDLSADDLVKLTRLANDYSAKIIGSQKVSGRDCYEIELLPKSSADVLWGKLLLYIDKIEYIQLKTVFYDEDISVVNTLVCSELKVFDGRKLASRLVMTPANKTGYQTTIVYSKIIFDKLIPDSFFSKENIAKIKP
jgi:outer membrane lipoprotein-sorting protein